jgi:nitroreductase
MELKEAIFTRRSIRKFTEEQISNAEINELIEAACWAPNASNQQMWHFVVVKKKEMMEAMAQAVIDRFDQISAQLGYTHELDGNKAYALFFAQAPVTIAVLMRPVESKVTEALRKLDYSPLEIQRLRGQSDLQSIGAALQNLLLLAHAKGYGACWMCAPLIASREIEKILGVEEPWQLKALVPLGKPAVRGGKSTRKALAEVLTILE